ncbi:hypothetical protein GUJ93_ZPchr0006g45679 [Zizania palustris]|uniref:Uncharacterized protein n=1 Tax=Zizania palustris TaxID=103762 RepID=A0A8J5TCB3_ZIZPA|nr:hypothetical protein GUJ93_ZPchr0006g45679 [Zizania palustris]
MLVSPGGSLAHPPPTSARRGSARSSRAAGPMVSALPAQDIFAPFPLSVAWRGAHAAWIASPGGSSRRSEKRQRRDDQMLQVDEPMRD